MTKKFLVNIFLILFLSSCFWSDDTVIEDPESSISEYSWSWFTISIPNNWDVISDRSNILPKPSFWEIELAVSSRDFNLWFSNNMLVLWWKLWISTNSKDYSIVNNLWASKEYMKYKELSKKDFVFNDSENSYVYIFEAQYNENTPLVKFIQTAHICNNLDAYLITIALSTDIDDTSRYEDLIKTFRCK